MNDEAGRAVGVDPCRLVLANGLLLIVDVNGGGLHRWYRM